MEENKNNSHDILNQIQESTSDEIHPFLQGLLNNGKKIAIGVGAAIVIAAGASGYSYMNSQKKIATTNELGKILVMYSGEKEVQELEKFLATVPSNSKPAVQLALAKALMDSSQYEKAVSIWKDLANDPSISSVAILGQAKSLLLSGKPADAVKLLQDLKGKVGDKYQDTINTILAESASKAGEKQLAINSYEALIETQPARRVYFESKIKELKNK